MRLIYLIPIDLGAAVNLVCGLILLAGFAILALCVAVEPLIPWVLLATYVYGMYRIGIYIKRHDR